MDLAERIKQARQLKNFSQKQLASYIGVSGSAISQYESNSYFHSEPSIKKLISISKALDVSIEWLATGRGVKNIQHSIENQKTRPPDTLSSKMNYCHYLINFLKTGKINNYLL